MRYIAYCKANSVSMDFHELRSIENEMPDWQLAPDMIYMRCG